MAAELTFFEADGVTPLAELALGSIPPGQSYFGLHSAYLTARLKNTGDTATTVEVSIQQALSDRASAYLRLAVGDPSPGAFVDETEPLPVGTLSPDGEVLLHVDAVVPISAPLEDVTSAILAANGT